MFGNERKNKVSGISSKISKFPKKKNIGNFSKQVYVQYKIFFCSKYVKNLIKYFCQYINSYFFVYKWSSRLLKI